ncbi:uncharacterized protein LOC117229780 [Megalopta genalis]|uniref:uncharacterized protein LOC117229780 n=1 Tax=Megalopta genalis TaxID=115081 RepID=UPI003FD1A1E8
MRNGVLSLCGTPRKNPGAVRCRPAEPLEVLETAERVHQSAESNSSKFRSLVVHDSKNKSIRTTFRISRRFSEIFGGARAMTDANSNKGASGSSKRSFEQAKKELHSIVAKIEETGLTNRTLKLVHAQSLLRPRGSKIRKRHLWILLIFAWILGQLLWNHVRVARDDRCLAGLPSFTQKIFRPAEDCSICRDVQQVDRISNVVPGTFEERYAYSGRPVVVTDATTNWTAPGIFSFAFFKSLYDGENANCQFFPYKTGFKGLQDVFNMSASRSLLEKGTEPWYVGWSNCDEKIGNILRQHYHRPYFLPSTAETEKTDWIFMGSHGYGAPMHVDDVEHPSWQAQIKGAKVWVLEPPRECHYTCNRLEIVVQPGEIIVLDTNRWYHQTQIVSEEMSITIGAEYD